MSKSVAPPSLTLLDVQLWYEKQRSGLGAEFHCEVSQVIESEGNASPGASVLA